MANSNNKPIFIHSLFRSGSTYLFNVFRRSSSEFFCYQEPFNDQLISLNDNPDILLSSKQPELRHPEIENSYFFEFHQVRNELKGLFFKSFSYDDFFVNNSYSLSEDQSEYLTSLISHACNRPVLQFCRSSGRISALQHVYSGVHIHLWRNPHDQWWSFKINGYFDAMIQLIYNAKQVPPVLQVVKKLCDISEYHNDVLGEELEYFINHPLNVSLNYLAFYAFWLYSFLECCKYCDVSISIDELSSNKKYQDEVLKDLTKLGIDGLDFSDCKVHRSPLMKDDFYKRIENQVLEIFLSQGYEKCLLDKAINACEEITVNDFKPDGIKTILNTKDIVFRLLDQSVNDKNRVLQAEAKAEQAEAKAEQAEVRAESAKQELVMVYHSLSWKFTRPLRWLKTIYTKFIERLFKKI